MIFFRVVLFHPSTTLRFGRYNLFIYRMALLWLNLYTVISNQIKQWSHIEKFEFLGLFREWLSFTWRNLLVSYHFSVIAMETRSYWNTGKQYIFYWDILTIAVVIWIPKNTSIYLAFVFIDFPLCWTLYSFVWWAICSSILSSQNSLKYCNDVISAAFCGSGLNSFL